MRVLIVDDDDDTVEIFSELLTLWGHETRAVRAAAAAEAAALEFLPDVILLDLSMPVLDGCEVARRLRRQSALGDPLLVTVTGHGLQKDIDRAHAAGFDVHLLKPVSPQRLRAVVEERPSPPRPPL